MVNAALVDREKQFYILTINDKGIRLLSYKLWFTAFTVEFLKISFIECHHRAAITLPQNAEKDILYIYSGFGIYF